MNLLFKDVPENGLVDLRNPNQVYVWNSIKQTSTQQIKSSGIDQHIYGQLNFEHSTKSIHWEEKVFLTNGIRKN